MAITGYSSWTGHALGLVRQRATHLGFDSRFDLRKSRSLERPQQRLVADMVRGE